MKNKTCLITGASSGIGAHCAYEYAKKGFNLLLVARREEKLKAVQEACLKINNQIKVEYIICDLSQEEDLSRLAQKVDSLESLDHYLANAGVGDPKLFKDLKYSDFDYVMNVNLNVIVKSIELFLEKLKASGGQIGIVGSVQSFIPLPQMTAYGVSKFAVRALAETLFLEFKALGVGVTFIAPGFIATEIRTKGIRDVDARVKDPVPSFLIMPVETAAKKIAKAMVARKRQIILTFLGKFAVTFYRFFPGLYHLILRSSVKP